MAVGELLLSAVFQVLFDRLAPHGGDLLNFVSQLGGGVASELKKWEDCLMMIQAVLRDAEEKQLTDEAVKLWLDDLRDLAYDAEDILDEFATKALDRKFIADRDHGASSSKVQMLVPAGCFGCFKIQNTVNFNGKMRSSIKDITGRFDRLCNQRIHLGLQLTPGGTSSTTTAQRRTPTSSVSIERAVFGRQQDKAKMLEMVLTDTSSDHSNLAVIPIVGMAGVGKTTLAREVYNDRAIEDSKFDVKAWVCVSDDFDVLNISRALLESITFASCDLKALNEVQVQIKRAVDGKKLLLVLDDVWNEDYCLWEDLKAPFLAAAPNSKIIVTTRHAHVASTMEPIQQYNLQCLSDEDCWSLFMMHAFVGQDITAQQISDLFREKVVGKCGGLPLAAKTLGGLLRSKRHDEWDEILNSNILDLPQQNGILSVLRLSYHYLPSQLKRCFAYCAIFPKDYEFQQNELVFLWIAEGVIQQYSENNKQPEKWGRECFRGLVSRSIFQQSCVDSSKFVMHDLVHDLTQLVSGDTIFRLEEVNKPSRRFERVRHYSYNQGWCDGKNKFEVIGNAQLAQLRTFLQISTIGATTYITNMFLSELLPKFKKLRVLSLKGYYITQLPISFDTMRSLRYLNLEGSSIKSLPESTSLLLNLQILILRDCYCLIKLPSKMGNLLQLRHLDIKGANSLKGMPPGMKELKCLQTLSNFIVGKGKVSTLTDLKNLNFLGGELCISGLENVDRTWEASEAMLCEKQNLEALSLQWGSQFDNSRNKDGEELVLGMLKPCTNIKKLAIEGYGGKKFPSWIGDTSFFSKMEVLKLENCENCTSLPSLGLLSSLKHLTIKGLMKLKSMGAEVYGEDCSKPFQSLEILCFENLPEWEYWDTKLEENGIVAGFSSLRELSMVRCPLFSGKLPEHLPSLEKLVVSKCGELVVSFSSFLNLCKLEIHECKGLVCSTPIDSKLIESMTISNDTLQIRGCKGMIHSDCTEADSVTVISNILELRKFLKQGLHQVETLRIGNFEWITSWHELEQPEKGLQVITSPEEVSIDESCVSLVSFPEIKFFLNNLRSLKIGNARALKTLPEEIIGNNSQLESLYIRDCDSVTFIARSKLPASLKRLEIENCKNLQHLVDGGDDDTSSSSSVKLKHLEIRRCPELTSLSSGIQLLEGLEYLHISSCPELKSIPNGLHNLQSIWIADCEKLEALPSDMHKLNSLQHFYISECPSIVSFPEEGFPTNLTTLSIGVDVKIYKPLIQWGLHRLTSLRSLDIYGCDEAECFPDEEMGMMLPTSLRNLFIVKLSKLKYLSSMGFQSLTSLEFLLLIKCPNLKSFPEEGLPTSLLDLTIEACPKLKKECKRDKGKEWPKIANIPCVNIDGKFLYE
ncbi:putative disease resistance protein [Citrus sinensis]|uniref:Disease resistance protein n=1 Tax=Citrus sinensis TaxID=2711 RepID=A0ACB8MAL5_CITSI|nr:putative disease resistance protein [Citrus sinensis]